MASRQTKLFMVSLKGAARILRWRCQSVPAVFKNGKIFMNQLEEDRTNRSDIWTEYV
jgi:hypothetical protein